MNSPESRRIRPDRLDPPARADRTGGPWTKLGIGDDCAILDVGAARDLLVTTDMLMDGRHFRLAAGWARSGRLQGAGREPFRHRGDGGRSARRRRRRRLAARRRGRAWHKGSMPGMRELAERFGVDLVGGDTNAWDGPLVISVTLLGEATARGAVRRAGARPGDAILVTGPLGGSLFAGRHLRPEPRIAEALALHEAAPIHAMIDISDGLSSDLGHILDESGGLGSRPRRSGDSDPCRCPRDEPARWHRPRSITRSTTAKTSSSAWSSRADDAARLLAAPPARPRSTASAR